MQANVSKLTRIVQSLVEEHPKRGQLEFIGNVKDQQIANARRTFAAAMSDDEHALAMLDSSMAATGKAGILVTTRRVYVSSFSSPIDLSDIESVEAKQATRMDAMLNLLFGLFYPVQDKLMINGAVAYAGRTRSYFRLWEPEFWGVLIGNLAAAVRDE